MKQLKGEDVIRIMKEEWDNRVRALSEDVDVTFNAKVDGDQKTLIAPELKVVHKKSGIRYTVSSVSPREVILRTPEGEEFLVDKETLESEYTLG